jgi:hypothetical protein
MEEPVWYVRNLRHVDVGFRLTRQQKQGEKRTNLKPRGSRGDMLQLQQGDLKDPELQTQVGYGLVEVIPEGEARAAISKQFTNQQTQVPAHIASLRNPKGEAYEQANPVRIASDDEAYGVKVADLDPGSCKASSPTRRLSEAADSLIQTVRECHRTLRPVAIQPSSAMASWLWKDYTGSGY